MNMTRNLVVCGVMGAVFFSALATVLVRHHSRMTFIELEALQQRSNGLDVEWERLQLEQATLAEHGRVETRAKEQLGMTVVDRDSIRIIQR